MPVEFRPARRSEAKPLIGLYSRSGCGKTLSALYLARGFVGPNGRIGMIETEEGRGEAYADVIPGGYLVLPIRGDFSPKNYGEALTAGEQAKLDALIIDSASHEWESTGGVLDMAATNQAMGKSGVQVWQTPKIEHARHFMLRLLSTSIPLVIVCMRAKYPMEEKTVNGKKQWVKSELLEPKQSEDILFELFVHGWIDEKHCFHGTKYTRDELRQVMVDGQPISIETGTKLAAWARGEQSVAVSTAVGIRPSVDGALTNAIGQNTAPQTATDFLTAEDIRDLEIACIDAEKHMQDLRDWVKRKSGVALEQTPREKLESIHKWLSA